VDNLPNSEDGASAGVVALRMTRRSTERGRGTGGGDETGASVTARAAHSARAVGRDPIGVMRSQVSVAKWKRQRSPLTSAPRSPPNSNIDAATYKFEDHIFIHIFSKLIGLVVERNRVKKIDLVKKKFYIFLQ